MKVQTISMSATLFGLHTSAQYFKHGVDAVISFPAMQTKMKWSFLLLFYSLCKNFVEAVAHIWRKHSGRKLRVFLLTTNAFLIDF